MRFIEGEAIDQSAENTSDSRATLRDGSSGNRSSGPAAQKQQIIWLKEQL